MRAGGFIAPLVVDGVVTSELFLAYLERVLTPELSPGDAVVLKPVRARPDHTGDT